MTGAKPEGPPCPICGRPGVPIEYGMPGPEMVDEAEAGRIVLGGCVVTGYDPDWACTGPERHVWRVGEEALATKADEGWSE